MKISRLGSPVYGSGGPISMGAGQFWRMVTEVGIQACWADDHTIWLTRCHDYSAPDKDASWSQADYDVATDLLAPLVDDHGKLIPGATPMRAGGGLRAWRWPDGVRDSRGRFFPGAQLADVSPEGILVIKPDYQADGGLAIYWPGDTPLTPTHLIPSAACGDDAVEGLHARLVGEWLATFEHGQTMLRQVTQVGIVDTPGLVQRNEPVRCWGVIEHDGVPWVLEQNGNDAALRLTLRPFNSTMGIVLATGIGYAPTIVKLPSGRVQWWRSAGLGQAPGEANGGTVDLDGVDVIDMIDLDAIPQLHYVDVTEGGAIVHGAGLRQLYLSAEQWADGLVHIGWKDWASGQDLAMLDGRVLGRTGGENCILVTRDTCYWIDADLRHYWRLGDDVPLPLPFPDGSTQGFAYFDYDANRIVWMDDVLKTPRPLARRHQHKRWAAGLDPDADRVLAIGADGQRQIVADVYTPVQAKIRELPDGSAICAISLPKDNATYIVPSSAFRPYEPPKAKPTTIDRAIWVGADGPGLYGNCTWGDWKDGKPFFEGAKYLPDDATCRARLKALLFLPKEFGSEHPDKTEINEHFDLTVHASLKFGVPIVVANDGPVAGAREWVNKFRALGLHVLVSVRCYPGDQFNRDIRDLLADTVTIDGVEQDNPNRERLFAVVTAVYLQAWNEMDALITRRQVNDLVRDHPECVLELAFGDGRKPPQTMTPAQRTQWDTEQTIPSDQQGKPLPGPGVITDDDAQIAALQPKPAPAPEPQPEPEPQPVPTPNQTEDPNPHHHHDDGGMSEAEKAAAIAATIGGTIAAIGPEKVGRGLKKAGKAIGGFFKRLDPRRWW